MVLRYPCIAAKYGVDVESCSEDLVERGARLYFSSASLVQKTRVKLNGNGPGAESPAQEKTGAVMGICKEGQLFSEGVHSSPKHVNWMHISCHVYPPILYPLIF